ncbi:thiamine diphosphate-binding protein, partial [Rozella allomycis CSF55]
MREAWRKDPSSVHVSWKAYFENLERNVGAGEAFVAPPLSGLAASIPAGPIGGGFEKEVLDHMKVQLLVRAYQVRGHHKAVLDPLGILSPDLNKRPVPELDLAYYGFTEADLDRKFTLGQGILLGFRDASRASMSLREIVEKLDQTYCRSIGFEYMHVPDRAKCDWLRARIEKPVKYVFGKDEKWMIMDRMCWSDTFERFVQSKYPGEKRFGLDGCEALIPGMKAMIDKAVGLGVEEVVMGMPHRGRLNVLSNVVRKPNESIFCEFNG